MARRSIRITDYSGDEMRPGDLVCYAARYENTVRLTDAVVEQASTVSEAGRLRPMLLVRPTGSESGFAQRRSLRAEWIAATHVRLVTPGYALGGGGTDAG